VGQATRWGDAYHAENINPLRNDKSLDFLLSPVKDCEYTPRQLKRPKRKKQKGDSR